jgi:H+-transporting ATPase
MAIVGTQIVAVFMCAFGWLVPPISWRLIGYTWAYIIVWMIIQYIFKMGLHTMVSNRETHKRRFMDFLNRRLHLHPQRR